MDGSTDGWMDRYLARMMNKLLDRQIIYRWIEI